MSKNIFYCIIFEHRFSKNEAFKHLPVTLGIWFFCQLQRPLYLGFVVSKRNFQFLSTIVLIKIFARKFREIKFDVRLWRYCYFKKTVNLISTYMDQYLKIKFSEKSTPSIGIRSFWCWWKNPPPPWIVISWKKIVLRITFIYI